MRHGTRCGMELLPIKWRYLPLTAAFSHTHLSRAAPPAVIRCPSALASQEAGACSTTHAPVMGPQAGRGDKGTHGIHGQVEEGLPARWIRQPSVLLHAWSGQQIEAEGGQLGPGSGPEGSGPQKRVETRRLGTSCSGKEEK